MTQTMTSTISEIAKRKEVDKYTLAGFTLFPCKRVSSQKKPIRAGWQNTPYDPLLDSDELPDIYGVLLTSEMLILDVDPRRYTRGEDQLRELSKKLNLPKLETFIVETGSGGLHIYLTKPADVYVKGKVPGFPAIDIKTKGGFVVGAGSIHENGNQYMPVRGERDKILPCPAILLQYISKKSPTTVSEQSEDVVTDDEGAKDRYIKYLMQVAPLAISGYGGDAITYRVACEGRDYGLSEQVVYDLLADYYNPRCKPEWTPQELKDKVKNAFQYAQNKAGQYHPSNDFAEINPVKDSVESEIQADVLWDYTRDMKVDPNLSNCLNYFQIPTNPIHNMLQFNTFANQVEFRKPAPWHNSGIHHAYWDDSDVIMCKLWFSREKHVNFQSQTTHEAAIAASRLKFVHPVREYLTSLTWDKVERLDTWLTSYGGAGDSIYTREVGKNTLIGLVARIMNPGVKHDHTLILEGAQGTGKSSCVAILGGDWYADIKIDPDNKDTIDAMQGAWIIEASEMAVIKRNDVLEALKGFLTRTHDKVRPSYGRNSVIFPRQCAFIGTMNPDSAGTYFSDSTGNRRFWPVRIVRFDLKTLQRDRNQLWAEAFHRYIAGESWHITDKEVEAAAMGEQQSRVLQDSWTEIVSNWLAFSQSDLPKYLTTEAIAYGALSIHPAKLGRFENIRIVTAMKNAGYKRKHTWDRSLKKNIYTWVADVEKGDI